MQLELPHSLPLSVNFPWQPGKEGRTPAKLFRTLDRMMEGRLASLVLTANRSRFLSSRPAAGGGYDLRLHGCFLEAQEEVLQVVAGYATGALRGARKRQGLATLRSQFDRYRSTVSTPETPRRKPRVRLEPRGKTMDLRSVRDELNERFFDGRVEAEITWGRALPRRTKRRTRRQTLRLGSYDGQRRLIRIHRVLDEPGVPPEVVEAVVYHEMLHADLPPVVVNGRRYSHTPEFRRREKLFPAHEAAERWLESHLPKLLAARYRRC